MNQSLAWKQKLAQVRKELEEKGILKPIKN